MLCHGATPQVCRDPIVAGAHVVTAIQAAVARGVGSRGVAVVTVGSFNSGTTHNVIPDRAHMLGTIRTYDREVRDDLFALLRRTIEDTATAHGTTARVELTQEYPVLINDPGCADAVRRCAARVVGADRVTADELPLAAAEDFAYFAQARPSAYFFLGAGQPVGETPGCHHPDFDFDDDLIPVGIKVFVELARERTKALAD